MLFRMSDVTRILSQIESGNPAAAEQLLPLVYDELRKLAAARLAQEKPGQTLQATALVHEAYIRLVGGKEVRDQKSEVGNDSNSSSPTSDLRPPTADRWNSRGHFFGAAAEAMRRILVESARRKAREKRGGSWQRLSVDAMEPVLLGPDLDLLALDDALAQLEREHPQKAQLVKLRFFAGLTLDQAASAIEVSSATADRYWKYARAWLAAKLREADPREP
jgi:DNA-directed RNA polymerase specialized sigma24 family protein